MNVPSLASMPKLQSLRTPRLPSHRFVVGFVSLALVAAFSLGVTPSSGLEPGSGAVQSPEAEIPAAVKKALDEASELLQRRDPDRAISVLRRADKKFERADVKLMLASAYNMARAFKNAQRTAVEALALTTDDFERGLAENLTGVALFAGGGADPAEMAASVDHFKRAYELSDGEISSALLSQAEALLQLERDDEAVLALEAFLESGPDPQRRARAEALLENPVSARTPMLPSFASALLDGEYMTSEDLEGKVVLFDFWATWCAPCRASLPHLRKLSGRRGRMPFEIVSVTSERDVEVVRTFIAENGMDWPQIQEEDQELSLKLGVRSLPTYLIVNHEGEIVFRTTGWSPSMEQYIERELNKAVRLYRKDSKRKEKAAREASENGP